ncbi:MAG: pyrroline-5-carboxylate reductase [Nitriliruptoraceae bacterium]
MSSNGTGLGFIGSGRMADAIVRGLLAAGIVEAEGIVCSDPQPERLAELGRLGVGVTDDNAEVLTRADVIVLCVKPQVLGDVLAALGGQFHERHLVVSIAAGIRTGFIEGHVGAAPVVRVMPNTPMLVGQGMSAICAGTRADASHLDRVTGLLEPLGAVVTVDETDMDTVTAVSGSGPAYLFAFAEAMIDAGVAEGLDRDTATTLVVQTLLGASTMLAQDPDPATLRDRVTSPGGTTMAALNEFGRLGLEEIVAAGVRAARIRGEELAGG